MCVLDEGERRRGRRGVGGRSSRRGVKLKVLRSSGKGKSRFYRIFYMIFYKTQQIHRTMKRRKVL